VLLSKRRRVNGDGDDWQSTVALHRQGDVEIHCDENCSFSDMTQRFVAKLLSKALGKNVLSTPAFVIHFSPL